LATIRHRLTGWLHAAGEVDHSDDPTSALEILDAEPESMNDILPRFPVVRQGYDCGAVDEYVSELERELAETDRELAEVRGHGAPADEVQKELRRIGEQTSAVLIAAHEQQDLILRTAQEEAERRVAEAEASARAIVAESEARVREQEAQSEAMRAERDRLMNEIRGVSAALAALVDQGTGGATPQT
jgi:hypothetical protein